MKVAAEMNLVNSKSDDDLAEEIKKITGYEFKDRSLLVEAFTHNTHQENCSSYDRLEYIGDAVLGLVFAEEHYSSYQDLQPGDLTRLRAANVDTEKLARAALKHELHKLLRHNKPLLAGQIKEFEDGVAKYPLHSWGLIYAPKVLADIVESLIGAIYIDSSKSMNTTTEVAKNLLRPLITPESIQRHPVAMLHEVCQKNVRKVKVIDKWKETGEVEILLDGELVGKGKCLAKKFIAINRAAEDANQHIVSQFGQENAQDSSTHH